MAETKKDKPKRKLTNQQELFVDEYLVCWNATEAYMASHPKCKSRVSAASSGYNALRNPQILERVNERMKERAMGADEVLARLADQARATQYSFIVIKNDGAVFFNFNDPEAKKHLHLIKKIKTKRTRRTEGHGKTAEEWEDEWVEVELYDAQAALALLARHHKLLTDQVNLNLNDTKITVKLVKDTDDGS
jgi:phage terminase small subunit